MVIRGGREIRSRAIAVAIALAIVGPSASRAALADTQFNLLATFDASAQNPVAPLIQGADGNFYGTTSQGGDANAGTIVQLTPAGALTVLYTFTGVADGAYPYAGLLQGKDGNFYGTASQGGDSNAGTIFQLTPSGTFAVLYSFTGGNDGAYPYAGVVQGSDGNFYGTAYMGGASGAGTVYQLTPAGMLNALAAFTGGADGGYPFANAIIGNDGSLYGTASQGGANGAGVVFQLMPDGTLSSLHTFAGGATDGAYPFGAVIQATDGNFYGTTLFGGADDSGTVFQLTPTGVTTIVYAFTGGTDGAYPYGAVVQGTDGNLYGASETGGASGGGTAFQLATTPSLVTWTTPAPITYGTALGAAQLNATASVPGAFTYSPPAGTVLHAGLQTLTVSFVPTDTSLSAVVKTVTLTVLQAMPVVSWAMPDPIVYGTPLGGTQLDARANRRGTFTYDPPAGAVLGVGAQTLTAVFTPSSADYQSTITTVTLTVTQATPVITWTPAAVVSGAPLGAAQLNAVASTPGTFVYTPASGTVLDLGLQTLTAVFTPYDTTDFTGTSTSATVNVAVPGTSGGGNEYPLQFTPAAGGRGVTVAGYALAPDTIYGTVVIGNCSYYTVHSGSGRGGGYKTITTYYYQTCTWDPYGNLLSVKSGAPTAPPPIAINGTQTIYAQTATGMYTGTDSALPSRGFVFTPGSHYTWLTPSPYAVIQQALYTVTATIQSDGDIPLTIAGVQATALAGQASVASTTCSGTISIGSTCAVTVTYDPSQFRSPTGLAYDTLDIHVSSDAAQSVDFVQRYTIVLTPANTTDGD